MNAARITLTGTLTLAALLTLLAAPATAQKTVLDQGGFTDKKYSVKGSWKIERRGKQRVLVLSKGFQTKKGPDLKLFLSPRSLGKVSGKTATRGSLRLAKLKSNRGSQEYALPAGVDLSKYRSLLIHCEQYSVLWGGAALSTPGS